MKAKLEPNLEPNREERRRGSRRARSRSSWQKPRQFLAMRREGRPRAAISGAALGLPAAAIAELEAIAEEEERGRGGR